MSAENATIWTGLWGRVGGRKLESSGRSRELDTLSNRAADGLQGDETILDLGAGPGIVALAMVEKVPRGRVLALDLSEEMLARLRANAQARGLSDRVETVHADAVHTGLEDDSVDLVTSNVLLHELVDLTPLFAELLRVLKPGGRVVLRDFRRSLVSRMMVRVFHGKGVVGALTSEQLEDELRRAGFVDVSVERDGWAHIGMGRA